MSKVCPMTGCSHGRSMCWHEKAMVAMAVMAGLGAIGHWGLGLY